MYIAVSYTHLDVYKRQGKIYVNKRETTGCRIRRDRRYQIKSVNTWESTFPDIRLDGTVDAARQKLSKKKNNGPLNSVVRILWNRSITRENKTKKRNASIILSLKTSWQ